MQRALLPPRRTGRADFPHPALLEALVSGIRPGYLYPGLAYRHSLALRKVISSVVEPMLKRFSFRLD
jgi:hypothetical protein